MKFLSFVSVCLLFAIQVLQAQNITTLIPTNTATHTAVQNGDWFSSSTWDTGSVPSDAAIVVIPAGLTVTYEGQSSAHIFAIRVDGTFICRQTNSSSYSSLKFDTFVATMMSSVQFLANTAGDGNIYTLISPFDIEAHKNGTSGFSQPWNTAAINHYSDGATVYQVEKEVGPDSRFNSYAEALAGNTSVTELSRTLYDDGVGVTGRYGWDPTQLSLGIITMGELEIIGKPKLNMSKLAADAPNGQKNFQITDTPAGWEPGDTVVVTRGGNITTPNNGNDYNVIQSVNGNTLTCAINLSKNHEGRPSDNLHCYAGNLSRNIIFKSTNPAQIHQRGHLMAMHNSTNVQIRNASFQEMGRTDKSRLLDDVIWKQWLEPPVFTSKISALGQEICEMESNPMDEITNSRGRYSIHLHKTGAKSTDNMVYVTGCVVLNNPGWGITQHDSYATVSDNVVVGVTGAGIVSESGSELGFWDNNLVMDINNGHGYDKYLSALFHDDYLYSGQGLAMKGRGVICRNNVIADAREGVGIINMNPSISNHDRVDPEALATFRPGYEFDQFPLDKNGYSSEGDGVMPVEVALIMENTTVIDCYQGLRSIERDMGVNHESRSVFDGFICWGVNQGLSIVYQADYSFKDVFISGNGSASSVGLFLWKHSHNHVFENIKLADLGYGIMVSKLVESGSGALKTRNNGFTPWYLIDLTTENVGSLYQLTNDPPTSTVPYTEHGDNPVHLSSSELVDRPLTFTILDSTELVVDYSTNDFRFEIDGIITDDLGSYKMGIEQAEAQGTLRLEYPSRIYEFASQAKFEEYLQNNGVYYDNTTGEYYFIINEVLPNRRSFEYTSFPVRITILNPPASAVYASPLSETITCLNHIISRQASVTQSSTQTGLSFDGVSIDPYAAKAIDGNNNGRINCQRHQQGLLPVGSFSQTNVESEPWYDLDLGEEKLIDYIDIWNTVEINGADMETNSTHFQNFYVLISDNPFGTADLATARSQATHEYFVGPSANTKRKESFNNLNAIGRYVRIQAVGTTMLKLAEVEIIGKQNQPVLPVELSVFSAKADPVRELTSNLKWITLQEINASHFEVQHSTNGREFKTFEEVEAQGNSNEVHEYKLEHLEPKIGLNYYRLKMIGQDNSFEYSPVKVVRFTQPNNFSVYPNPSKGVFNIELEREQWLEKIEIYNELGQLVFTEKIAREIQRFNIQPELPKGIYNLSIFTEGNHRLNQAIIIQ